jgi:hypothetical protein
MQVGLVIPARATKIFQVQFHAGGACNLRIRLSAIPTFARGQKKNLSSAKADGVQFQPVGFVKPAFFRAQKLMERNSEGGGGGVVGVVISTLAQGQQIFLAQKPMEYNSMRVGFVISALGQGQQTF